MEQKLKRLRTILGESADLFRTAQVLGWDQQTYMPPGGAEDRSYLLSTVSKINHELSTSEELGRLLDDLAPYASQLDPASDDACLLKVARHDYDKQTRVPTEMVAEFAQVTALAQQAWQQAREENDFASFRPHLEKIVQLRRDYAALFAPYDHVYDPLLDDFEPGMKTADVQAIFSALRPQQVALIQAIKSRPQVDDAFLHLDFPEQGQWDFGVEVATRFGYNWHTGRQDKSAHPFTTSFGINDVRITTRFLADQAGSGLFSTMHEAGHAMYEQGVDQRLARSPLGFVTSLAMHESQSRMWENLVGRSMPFWEHFYPTLNKYFSSQLSGVSLEKFYKGINKVETSLVRVEADEATYNLHIMLRLELEIALMEGSLEVKDLPEAWNARMRDYLGVSPPNDALGVLQDIHWSSGYIGYFATYALGNLVSVQLWEKINQDIPDLADQFRRGEFAALLAWLREKIHRHGAKFEAKQLVQQVTGHGIDPAPYMRYLQTKYGEIYGL